MELKKGMLCKHFKGNDLIEKNIYEILAISVKYTGEKEMNDLSELVIYRPIFGDELYFAREYDDLTLELSPEQKQLYNQNYRVEALTEEEIKLIHNEEFIEKKIAYLQNKKHTK